jgi:hypothetical protein
MSKAVWCEDNARGVEKPGHAAGFVGWVWSKKRRWRKGSSAACTGRPTAGRFGFRPAQGAAEVGKCCMYKFGRVRRVGQGEWGENAPRGIKGAATVCFGVRMGYY